MQIFTTYQALLDHLSSAGHPIRILGHAPDGSPVVAVKAGGDRTPAIFITAGSHSTEQAGVSAAVALIERLDTDHQVYVIPTRDPIGMNPYAHALSLGLGEEPDIESFEDVEAILRNKGEVYFEEDNMILSLIGDYGFASNRPSEGGRCPQSSFYGRLLQLQRTNPEILAPFKGRRIYMTPGQAGVEGTGDFQRAYTLVISPRGEVLHINRFHDTVWAPVEVRCTRRLMAEINPGITFDLHESQHMEDRYWLVMVHPKDDESDENEAWTQRMARAVIRDVEDSGAVLAVDRDVVGDVPLEKTCYRLFERGGYWLEADIRGEGLNLIDYSARVYGVTFGTEMGMFGRFEQRVAMGMLTVQSAVRIFEERYK